MAHTRFPTGRAALLALLIAPAVLAWGGPPVRVGSIEGQVELNVPPPRRSAPRYRAGASQEIQGMPAVVYLTGPIPGGRAGGPAPTIAQRDTAFLPAVLFVRPGTSVAFPNEDPFFHNVFSYSSTARFDLGRYPQGESKSVTFTEPGIVKIYCEVHEHMRSVVFVTENPYHAMVGSDGRFRIEGVPAGTYTLVVWHTDLGEVEQEVRVSDGAVVRVQIALGR